jgi:hypothetical protein
MLTWERVKGLKIGQCIGYKEKDKKHRTDYMLLGIKQGKLLLFSPQYNEIYNDGEAIGKALWNDEFAGEFELGPKYKAASCRRSDGLYGVLYNNGHGWHFSGGCKEEFNTSLAQLKKDLFDQYWAPNHQMADYLVEEIELAVKNKALTGGRLTRYKLNKETRKKVKALFAEFEPKKKK